MLCGCLIRILNLLFQAQFLKRNRTDAVHCGAVFRVCGNCFRNRTQRYRKKGNCKKLKCNAKSESQHSGQAQPDALRTAGGDVSLVGEVFDRYRQRSAGGNRNLIPHAGIQNGVAVQAGAGIGLHHLRRFPPGNRPDWLQPLQVLRIWCQKYCFWKKDFRLTGRHLQGQTLPWPSESER